MSSVLIVLALLALAVGIVVWATRRKPARPNEQRLEQDTAWNDPITPTEVAASEPTDPFAGAPTREEPRP